MCESVPCPPGKPGQDDRAERHCEQARLNHAMSLGRTSEATEHPSSQCGERKGPKRVRAQLWVCSPVWHHARDTDEKLQSHVGKKWISQTQPEKVSHMKSPTSGGNKSSQEESTVEDSEDKHRTEQFGESRFCQYVVANRERGGEREKEGGRDREIEI